MRLAERGRLDLDDPIAKHFLVLASVAQGATIRHLLSHTSGLSSVNIADDPTQPFAPPQILAALAGRPREFAPGERFRYNNHGYLLLGLVAQAVQLSRNGKTMATAPKVVDFPAPSSASLDADAPRAR